MRRRQAMVLLGLLAIAAVGVWALRSEPHPPSPPSAPAPSIATGDDASELRAQTIDAEVDAAGDTTAPPLGFEIRGRVRAAKASDAQGRSARLGADTRSPIAGARLVAIDAVGSAVAEVSSNAEGDFVLGPLPLALYRLQVSADGFGNVELADVIPGGPDFEVLLQAGFELAWQTVDPSGNPVAARCYLGAAGLYPARIATSDADGWCRFAGLGEGAGVVTALAPGAASTWMRVRLSPSLVTTPLVVRPSPPVVIEVVDSAGLPVPDAMVTLAPNELHVLALRGLSDKAGALPFDSLPLGLVFASARATGFLPAAAIPLASPCAAEPCVHRLVLSRAARASGRVVDEAGVGVVGARLIARVRDPQGGVWFVDRDTLSRVHPLVRPAAVGLSTSSYVSGADGSFELAGLPAGRVELEAWRRDLIPSGRVSFELAHEGHASGLLLHVAKGQALAVRIENAAGGGLGGASLRWRPEGGDVWSWSSWERANGAGELLLPAVPPRFEVELAAEGYRPLQALVSAPPTGEALALRLELLDGELRGRASDENGPIADARVRRLSPEASISPRAQTLSCAAETDARGGFVLQGCGEGEWLLELQAKSGAPAWFAVRSGDDAELVRPRAASLHGELPREVAWASLSLAVDAEVVGGAQRIAWDFEQEIVGPEFTIESLPPGRYRVRIETTGSLPSSFDFELAAGARHELGAVALRAPAAVEGWVLDETGAPVGNVCLGLSPGDCALRSDASGAYRMVDLEPGETTLWARHGLFGAGHAPVHAVAGETARVDLRLSSLAIEATWSSAFAADGVELATEERGALVVELGVEGCWHGSGLVRGDVIEWAELDSSGSAPCADADVGCAPGCSIAWVRVLRNEQRLVLKSRPSR